MTADLGGFEAALARAVQQVSSDLVGGVAGAVGQVERALAGVDTAGLDTVARAASDAAANLVGAAQAGGQAAAGVGQAGNAAQGAAGDLGRADSAAAQVQAALAAVAAAAARAHTDLGQAGNAAQGAANDLGRVDSSSTGAAGGLGQVGNAAGGAQSDLRGLNVQIININDSFNNTGGAADDAAGGIGNLAGAAAGAVTALAGVAGAVELIGQAIEQADLNNKLAAQLNLSAEESEKAGRIASGLYAGAWGESMEHVNESVGAVVSSLGNLTDDSEEDIARLTATALDLSTAFGIDVAESAQLANQMIRTGIAENGVEAFDLLTAAMQSVPAQMRAELIPVVGEYGGYLTGLGLSGSEAMGVIVNAAQGGQIEMDKFGDALKEFQIRATDMSTATGDAYEALGLDQREMTNALLAGGETARVAFDQIVAGLRGIEDPADQSAAALALFGTPLEDLGVDKIPQFLTSLTHADSALGDVTGRAQEFSDTLNSGPGVALESFRRTLQQGIIGALTDFGTMLWDNRDAIREFGIAVAPVVAVVGGYAAGLAAVRVATLAWAAAQAILNTTFLSSPLGWIALAIGAVVGAVIYAYRNFEGFRNVVQAAWEGIKTATSAVWEGVLKPALAGITTAVQAVGGFFVDLWQNWVSPALTAIGDAAVWLWQNVLQPTWDALRVAVAVVAVAFQLAWEVIKVVFDVFASTASWLWETVLQPVFGFISGAWELLAGAVKFYWENVVKPAWDALAAAANWLWTTVLQPVFDKIKAGWSLVGDGVRSVWENVIRPAWDALGAGVSWVWENGVRPVFDALKTGVNAVGEAFDKAVTWIGEVWDKVVAIAARPAKFVVQTVYNEGIRKAWNKVSGWLGLDELPEAPLGKLASYARGGTLPGYTPGRDVHRFVSTDGSMALDLSGGEVVFRPEVGRVLGTHRVDAINAAAAMGGPAAVERELSRMAFATGGTVPAHLGSFAGGGTIQPGVVMTTAVQRRMWDLVRQRFPMMTLTSATRNEPTSQHGHGLAIDFSNGFDTTPQMRAARDWIAQAYPPPVTWQLLHKPGENNIGGGQWVGAGYGYYGGGPGGVDGHHNHVHWAAKHVLGEPGADVDPSLLERLASMAGSVVESLRTLVARAFDAVMDPVGKRVPEFGGGVGKVPRAAFDTMRDSVREWLLGKADDNDTGGVVTATGSGPVRDQVRNAMAPRGWDSGTQWDAVDWIVQKESGWNPAAQNPSSTAYGLFQFLDSTWATVGGTKTSDPYQQGVYGGRYIAQRYGTPVDAQAFWRRNNWYDLGGVATGAGLLPKYTPQPERVLSPRQTTAFEALVSFLTHGGPQHGANRTLDTLEGIRDGVVTGLLPATLRETGAVVEVAAALAESATAQDAVAQALGEGLVADTSGLYASRSTSSHESVRAAQEEWLRDVLESLRPEWERLQREVLDPAFAAGKARFDSTGDPVDAARAAGDVLVARGREFGEEALAPLMERLAAPGVDWPAAVAAQAGQVVDARRIEIHSPVHLHGVRDYGSFEARDAAHLLSKLRR